MSGKEGLAACTHPLATAAATDMLEMGVNAVDAICANIFTKDDKPVLTSGPPSVSLTENIFQNSINMLDFGLDIETSVDKPRSGGSSMADASKLMFDADMGEKNNLASGKVGLQI